MLLNGKKIDAEKSIIAKPMTNLDPGWLDARRKYFTTNPFPIVPDTSMNE